MTHEVFLALCFAFVGGLAGGGLLGSALLTWLMAQPEFREVFWRHLRARHDSPFCPVCGQLPAGQPCKPPPL